jgi:hypothetical protein
MKVYKGLPLILVAGACGVAFIERHPNLLFLFIFNLRQSLGVLFSLNYRISRLEAFAGYHT